jgi:phage recombination protein Bet
MEPSNQVIAAQNAATLPAKGKTSLVTKFADRFSVDGNKLLDTLKATAFKQRNGQPPTNHQMMALLVVADQYGLNPFTKEIYAFPDQQNGIVPVVGIDGWSRIINSHKQFDGMDFRFSEKTITLDGLSEPIYEWIECVMYRKDRERPTIIREYLTELYRPPFKKNGSNGPYEIKGPWQSHPRRFSRHKVIIQCARICLGYTGIYDEDEAQRIIDAEAKVVSSQPAIELDAEFDTEDTQSAEEPVQVEHRESNEVDAEFPEALESEPQAEYFNTSFGEVLKKDAKMISQMVNFTTENGSWDTTKDSFEERYDGATLEFALSELQVAFNQAFAED